MSSGRKFNRKFPSTIDQENAQKLRNNICRLSTPEQMAQVASHLRGYAIAETIGLIGVLDGHPQLKSMPTIKRHGAIDQVTRGTKDNPLAHAMPASILINGTLVANYFDSELAKNRVSILFGMGVMAPVDNNFVVTPSQVNILHNILEGFRKQDWLVAALENTLQDAARAGTWAANGKPRLDQNELYIFISEHYTESWRVRAKQAYSLAINHINKKLSEANKSGNTSRIEKALARMEILEADYDQFNKDSPMLCEATSFVWQSVAAESWRST